MVRRIASANEMFDILSNMDSGKFASFCHLNYAPIDNPKKGKDIDFDTIGKRFNIDDLKGIITITRYYDLNWSNQKSIAQKYASFRQSANDIRRKFGLQDAQKRKSPFQTVKHGLGIVLGNTPNIKDRAYFSQNTFNCKRDISYYGVNSAGRIICEFLPQHLKEYLKDRKRDIDGYNKLCKITQDEKVLGDYINQIMNLKMEYTRFMCDRVIYIIGADREGKFIFANNNLTSEINGLKIDKNQLLGIVQQKYKLDLNKINENTMNRKLFLKELNERENISIEKLSINDLPHISQYIQTTFEPDEELENITEMLNSSSINYEYSTKAVTDSGEIVGLCLLSNETLDDETDGKFSEVNPELSEKLNQYQYLTMFMIGINREYSRRGLLNHKNLLELSMSYIKGFDFLVVPIFNTLKTHKLWGRYGTQVIFKNDEETLYAITINKEVDNVIQMCMNDHIQNNDIIENTMKRQIVRLTEQDLHKVINESVRRIIKERILGQGESFTPYEDGEGQRMFNASQQRTPEERNPSYAKALRDAEERRRQREMQKKTSMEEEINEIGDTNRGQYALGRLAARQRMNGMSNKMTDDETGANNTFNYAYKQQQASNHVNARRNSFANGFHSSDGNKNNGYNMMKDLDNSEKVYDDSVRNYRR